MLSKIRPMLKGFNEMVAKPFALLRIDPNMFSLLGPLFAIISAYFISQQLFAEALIFAVVAVSIDLFDGAVARLQNRSSLFGNYFETMIDKLVEIILFIGAAFLHPLAAICALAFSLLNSYAKPRVALVIITDNRDWPAIGEHAERMILFAVGLALSIFSIEAAGFKAFEIFLWTIALVSFFGTIQRIFYAKKLIEEAEKKGNILPYLKNGKER